MPPPPRRGARARPPERFDAQLATLAKQAPAGDAWLHELKLDGYRIGCRVDGGEVTLLSRRGNDWTAQFSQVAAAARRLPVETALLDGEVCVVLPDGRTRFQALQNARTGTNRAPLTYFVFDLLHLDGEDIGALPLDERKARLQALLARAPGTAPVFRYADHVVGDGPAFFRQACGMRLEGIVSKQRSLPYQPGRGPGWLKVKCIMRQELVIGGFTHPEGGREGIGALLVGVYDGGRLRFAGKVGTGFSQSTARALRKQLDSLARATSPFTPPPERLVARDAHWVTPNLVAEVAFADWTDEGKIRHASFQGLRRDKDPREVVAEIPAPGAAGDGDGDGSSD